MGSRKANQSDGGAPLSESAAHSSPAGVVSPQLHQAMLQSIAQREAAKVYQLALWPETQRALPTEFIRSALFAAIQGQTASYLERVEIANANDLSIVYTGHRLTQVHADVWEGIMHLARGMPEAAQVTFRARAFLKLIGRHTGKRQREELRLWWAHLAATCVEIHDKKKGRRYFGSMLPRGVEKVDGTDSVYVVEINRELAQLFDRGFSTVDWEQRKRLMKKPLALWLQHHFSAFPKPVTVKTLHTLSGSNAQHVRQFRARLVAALHELQEVGVLSSHRFDNDILHVTLPDRTTVAKRPSEPPPARQQRIRPAASLTLPLLQSTVSEQARREFTQLYPRADLQQCLLDWHKWPPSASAKKPDAAFLGFAKKWASGKKLDS